MLQPATNRPHRRLPFGLRLGFAFSRPPRQPCDNNKSWRKASPRSLLQRLWAARTIAGSRIASPPAVEHRRSAGDTEAVRGGGLKQEAHQKRRSFQMRGVFSFTISRSMGVRCSVKGGYSAPSRNRRRWAWRIGGGGKDRDRGADDILSDEMRGEDREPFECEAARVNRPASGRPWRRPLVCRA